MGILKQSIEMCLWVLRRKYKGGDLEDYRKNKLTGYDASTQTSLSQDLDYPGGGFGQSRHFESGDLIKGLQEEA